MYTYRNTSLLPLEIPNVGVVEPDNTISADHPLHNPFLELVKENKPKKDS